MASLKPYDEPRVRRAFIKLITRQTLYRFVGPKGELRADATKLLKRKAQNVSS